MLDMAAAIVVWGAFLRGVAVVGAMVRSALNWKRFVRVKLGWVEGLNVLEPFLLLAWSGRLLLRPPEAPDAIAAWGGALLVLAGWALIVWTYFSWPEIYAGHAVLEDHELVTRGAYGRVRHPVYVGAFLIWGGLALGTWSLGALLVTALYVIPSYHLYARSEEDMMLDAFGDEYREYLRRTPMWIPRVSA
jgi:protein-S-isoprenylcysteine O-methyltransferase Ste14